jgi:hypothetical protein
MSEKFNPLEAVALLRASARSRRGPKLNRTEQYQAFAMIQSGVEHSVISKMFGVSKTTVSHLANCEARAPGRIHRYPDVFREWVRLGPEAFLEAYVTEENYIKAQRLKYNVDDGHKLDDRNGMHLVSNPRADACAHHIIGELNLGTWRARIDWAEADPAIPEDERGPVGWRYKDVGADSPYFSIDPNAEPIQPEGLWLPWRTSGECFDYIYLSMGMPSPRRGGRPRK